VCKLVVCRFVVRNMEVHILPLVTDAVLPVVSPATARSRVPPGYGVQEQCVPFTAATALGLLVPSPIAFGLCHPSEVPSGSQPFRGPLERPDSASLDPRVFYVVDDPVCRFSGNAFTFAAIADSERGEYTPVAPGISFFDREDQLDMFKLHLPYICRTSEGVETLFLAPINRKAPFEVMSGLVETDWYANPVNLILRKPAGGRSVHIARGAAIAQLVFIQRAHRRPDLKVLPYHARLARDLKSMMGEWYRRHDRDRSAYKHLVRTQHGQVDTRVLDPRSSQK